MNIEARHRRVAHPDGAGAVDRALLGKIVDFAPELDPVDLGRLDRPPIPDDVEIVETLVVDIVAVRLRRRDPLRGHEIMRLKLKVEAEVAARALDQLAVGRDLGAQYAQLRLL